LRRARLCRLRLQRPALAGNLLQRPPPPRPVRAAEDAQGHDTTLLYGRPFKCRACSSQEVTLFDIDSQAELDEVRPTVQRVEGPNWAVTNYGVQHPNADLP